MVITQARSRRKSSGGLLRNTLSKRTYMLGRPAALTKVGPDVRKRAIPAKGGNRKHKLFETNVAHIYDPKAKAFAKATITAVSDNPANRNFVRRNILTKGAIIETDKGKARITSRPGQDGLVNAVLI